MKKFIRAEIVFYDKARAGLVSREFYYHKYIPVFKFNDIEGYFSGRLEFLGVGKILPGDTVEAIVIFVRPDLYRYFFRGWGVLSILRRYTANWRRKNS